jgi:hypothetical protein
MKTKLGQTRGEENSANRIKPSAIGLLLGAGLLGTLTACVAPGPPPEQAAYYNSEQPPRANYAPPPREEYSPPPPREAPLRPPPREYAPAPAVRETAPRAEYTPPPREVTSPPPREAPLRPPPVRGEYAPPVRVDPEAVSEDDYVYYPAYEIYYNTHRNQYTYREGQSWVTGPAPPRIGVDVLLGAPSVRLDFHDAPPAHHATVIRQYPKHWAPPGAPRRERDEGP